MFKIAGTGSRELAKDIQQSKKVFDFCLRNLELAKEKHKEILVISGAAEGFDEVLAYAAIATNCKLLLAIPNKDYGLYYWKYNSVTKTDRFHIYEDLVSRAQEVKIICNSIYEDGMHSNFKRNIYMMQNADKVWVYNPSTPGTRHAYEYCKKMHIPTYLITV